MSIVRIRSVGVFGGLLLIMFFTPTVVAHDLHVFAAVEGKNITGYTYYHGGVRVPDVEIQVQGPGEILLGQTTTDSNGEFTFALSYKCEHTVIAVSQDGHRVTAIIKAESLPDDLPAFNGSTDEGSEKIKAPTGESTVAPGAEFKLSETQIRIIVDEAVAKQVRPLQEQIQHYENKIRLRDIVGGIGFIVGLAGISFYFAGKKKV